MSCFTLSQVIDIQILKLSVLHLPFFQDRISKLFRGKAQLEQKRFIFMTSLAHTAHTWSNSLLVDVSETTAGVKRLWRFVYAPRSELLYYDAILFSPNHQTSIALNYLKLRKDFQIQRMTSFLGVQVFLITNAINIYTFNT